MTFWAAIDFINKAEIILNICAGNAKDRLSKDELEQEAEQIIEDKFKPYRLKLDEGAKEEGFNYVVEIYTTCLEKPLLAESLSWEDSTIGKAMFLLKENR